MAANELVVIEGRWYDHQNLSVSTVFDTLSDLLYDTPHAYFHHQFSDAKSLECVIKHFAAVPGTRFLYIGAHGDGSGIYGSIGANDGKVSRAQLRNTLWRCWSDGHGKFDGLFLGSCGFVNEENAKYLLCGDKAPRSLKWVAGYCGDPDWVDSTLLDILFFRKVLDQEGESPVKRVENAVEELSRQAGGLCAELGFQVYVRKKGAGGGVKALIDYPEDGEDYDG